MRNIIKKKKNVYFSNMKKIIKHYPMTDELFVIRGYIKNNLKCRSIERSQEEVTFCAYICLKA